MWLTPRANEIEETAEAFSRRNGDRSLTCHGTLSSQAKAESETWPTPTAQFDMERNGPNGNPGEQLRGTVNRTQGTTGKLNPAWVETLMGLPMGHTQLPYKFVKPKRGTP